MASVDASIASDILLEHLCGPCKTDGKDKEARQYCCDCREYICDECVNYHKTLALTKNHIIEAKDGVATKTPFTDVRASMYISSDILLEHVCGPCTTDGIVKEAMQYCCDCREYLCDECVGYHKKLALTKNHIIKAKDSVGLSADGGRCLIVYCGCSNNEATEFYCEDHADVICSTCQSFKHHQCQTVSVQQKSSGYTVSSLDSVMAKAESIKYKYDQLKEKCFVNQKDMKRTEDCKKEIKSFRKDLDDFLDKLELDMLSELDRLEIEEHERTEGHMTLLTTALQMLDKVCNLLNEARKDGRKETMFAADIQTSKGMRDCENRYVDLAMEVVNIQVSFQKNKQLEDLQREIKKIGSLSIFRAAAMKRETMALPIQSRKLVTVRQADDNNSPQVTSCAVMPNGNIVICDRNNDKIKLLDKSFALIQSLELPAPWDVSVADANNVVITRLESKQLQLIQVFPKLKLGRVIQLDNRCLGVHVAADALYVTCHQVAGNGDVMVFDKHGKFMRRFGVSLIYPYFITFNTAGNKLFVSDRDSHTITCMTTDGNVIYKYKDQDLKYPRGLYCGDEDNVLVCDSHSNNVQLITADGKKGGTLLSAADGLKRPHSITYRKSDNVLIVGSDLSDKILICYVKSK